MVVHTTADDCDGQETRNERKIRHKTLLEKLDIPIQHLDFKFVENCSDPQEIEKVLRILRSGEEGYYPEFQDFVEKKLEELNPRSRHLRVETPVPRTNSLETSERSEIENDLSTWLGQCREDPDGSGDAKNIFHRADVATTVPAQSQPPIRGTVGVTTNVEIKPKELPGNDDNFLKPKNPNRIKSWEYEKWNKFNADAELTKLDIQDMREEELENQKKCTNENVSKKPKELLAATTVTTTTTSLRKTNSPRPSTSQETKVLVPQSPLEQVNSKGVPNTLTQKPVQSSHNTSRRELGPSFIEEISAEQENDSGGTKSSRTQRPLVEEITQKPGKLTNKEGKRFKIIIDDLRMT